MAKAARQLAMTQPSVSAAIANLEHMLGVRLLDRSPRGIEPTIYADAMLKRSVAVFDELKQSVKDVAISGRSDDRRTEDRMRRIDHRHRAPAIHRTLFRRDIREWSCTCTIYLLPSSRIPDCTIESSMSFSRDWASASTERPNHGRLECGVSLRRPADHRGRTAQPLGAPPYDRSCGADRGALDFAASRHMELRPHGGGFSGAGPRYARRCVCPDSRCTC